MAKLNTFKQENGNLILYPDINNKLGAILLGIFLFIFCGLLFYVNELSQHVSIASCIYISIICVLTTALLYTTAYNPVVFDNTSKTVKVKIWGILFKQVPFDNILKIEEREGTILPPCFYVILKNNHLGTSIRVSVHYKPNQINAKLEFYDKVLPLINAYLNPNNCAPIIVPYSSTQCFKTKDGNIYRYFPYQKLFVGALMLMNGLFLETIAIIIPYQNFSFEVIFALIICVLSGLYCIYRGFTDLSYTLINRQAKYLQQQSIFGFTFKKIPFHDILTTQVNNTSINGLRIYSSLFVSTAKQNIRIEKSVNLRRLSKLDNDLEILLKAQKAFQI